MTGLGDIPWSLLGGPRNAQSLCQRPFFYPGEEGGAHVRTHVKDGRKEHGPFTIRTPGSIQAKHFPGQRPAALAQGEDLVELGPQAPRGWVQGGERGGDHSPSLNSPSVSTSACGPSVAWNRSLIQDTSFLEGTRGWPLKAELGLESAFLTPNPRRPPRCKAVCSERSVGRGQNLGGVNVTISHHRPCPPGPGFKQSIIQRLLFWPQTIAPWRG